MSYPIGSDAVATNQAAETNRSKLESVIRDPLSSETFLIYTTEEKGHGHTVLWWRPNRRGYTRCMEEAGRYSHEEARMLVTSSRTIGAIRLETALRKAHLIVGLEDLGHGREPETHEDHA